MGRLDGRVALITGAARGIGRSIAQRFAAEGARLVLLDIREQELRELALSLAGQAQVIAGDVAAESTLQRAVAQAEAHYGRLDVLVNNAYAAVHRPAAELDEAEWRSTLDICLTGVFFSVKHAVPLMQRRHSGSIVNLSSVNGLQATPGMPAYAAAKGAILALSRQLALEYGPDGIRTNAVCPGFIATEDLQSSLLSDPAERQAAVESCPLRRVGMPEEIANAVLFLASDDASFINGATLVVDGGTSIQWPPVLLRPGLRRKAGLSAHLSSEIDPIE